MMAEEKNNAERQELTEKRLWNDILAERDRLKAENEELRAERAAFGAKTTTDYFEAVQALKAENAELRETLDQINVLSCTDLIDITLAKHEKAKP